MNKTSHLVRFIQHKLLLVTGQVAWGEVYWMQVFWVGEGMPAGAFIRLSRLPAVHRTQILSLEPGVEFSSQHNLMVLVDSEKPPTLL